jgi:antitoxin CptB
MDKEIFIKQLLYRSMHRGCKETDILLGKFIVDKILEFNDDKLQLYQNFIDEDDLMIYEWILNKSNIPEQYVEMVDEIRTFHNI